MRVFDRNVSERVGGGWIVRRELIAIAESVVIVMDEIASLVIISAILARL